MHDTAYRIGELVIRTYLPPRPSAVLEIGALDVNGSLRDHAPRTATYTGLDFEAGAGVDHVIDDCDAWPVPDEAFDLVMASSVFEHDATFWRTFLAMCRKTKPGGHIYVSAPSNGNVHRFPQDCWRFYPDAGDALERWARRNGFALTLVESFIAGRSSDIWNDFCAIFRKAGDAAAFGTDFVYKHVGAENVVTWQSGQVLFGVDAPEDVRLIAEAREATQRWQESADTLSRNLAEKEGHWQSERDRLAASAASEVDRLNGELVQRDLLLRESHDQVAVLGSRIEQVREEAEQAWRAVAQAEARREDEERAAARARGELDEAKGWVERLARMRATLEKQVSSLERQLLAANAARTTAEAAVQRRVASDQARERRSSAQRQDLAIVSQRLADAEQAARQLEARATSLGDELAVMSLRLEEAGTAIAEMRTINAWLRRIVRFLLEHGRRRWALMPRDWRRARRERSLRRNGLFDADAYRRDYPDVSGSEQDPLRHFVVHGMDEGRTAGLVD